MEVDSIVAELRQTFDSGKTRPITYRKEQLRNLYHLVVVSPERSKWLLLIADCWYYVKGQPRSIRRSYLQGRRKAACASRGFGDAMCCQ